MDTNNITSITSKCRQEDVVLLRRNEVERITGISRARIYTLMKTNSFPGAIHLGNRSVAWISSEIQEWIASRIAASRQDRH